MSVAIQTAFRYSSRVFSPCHRRVTICSCARNPASFRHASHVPGFSLVELLVTLALVIVMSVMLYGFGSRNNQQKQLKNCERNLQNIHMALEIFANEHGERFPAVPGATTSEEPLSQLVPRYTVASDAFICPGSKHSALPTAQPFADRKISYAYFMGRRRSDANEPLMTDAQVNTRAKAAGDPIYSSTGKSPGNNHHKYGGNCLFTDGHVEFGPTNAALPLSWSPDIVLLNPKP